MRHFAQTHGSGKARTALERVQVAQHLAARRQIVRICGPLAQRRAQPGQQLLGFFFKYQEQVGIDDVMNVHRIVHGQTHSRPHLANQRCWHMDGGLHR
ncbi:hypothetical protein D3C71_1877930 [compost metagenome]